MRSTFFAFCLLLFGLLSSYNASAQSVLYETQYRPHGLKWLTLETPNFRIIYPTGDDSLARRAGMILEQQYPSVKNLIGAEITKFPFVLNNYNDLSNGFVTPFNFRSEIESPSIKDKLLNPRTGDWYETVLPHELVHVLQFNKKGGVADILRLFWPDGGRFINGFPPVGVHEGIAVYHESSEHVSPYGHGGRLNYSFFTNRARANFSSGRRWTGGQIFITSDYSRPFNRHYLAGSPFTHWLQKKYGEETTKKAIERHYKWFFLGYGLALKNVTGKSPKKLIAEYHADTEIDEKRRIAGIPNPTTPKSSLVELPYKGIEVHRPVWINDKELVYAGAFYNARSGFYRYHIDTKKNVNIDEGLIIRDYNYEVRDEKLLYSKYYADERFDRTFKADVGIYDFRKRKNTRLTYKDRVFSPAYYGDEIVALQTKGSDNSIVFMDLDGNIQNEKISFPDTRFISVNPNPRNRNQWAVIANKRGVQAIWLTTRDGIKQDLVQLPDIGFINASAFDLFWHPTKNAFLFTVDRNGVMNVHEYDLDTDRVTQLTQSYYNAFEASLSPDGNTLAYILQKEDERWLALLEKEHFYNATVPSSEWKNNTSLNERINRPLLGAELSEESKAWEVSSYKSDVGWLTPRAFLPVVENVPGSNISEVGLGFLSVDALQSQSYYAEITGAQNRAWWEVVYTNNTFWPGFQIEAFSRPSFTRFEVDVVNTESGEVDTRGPFTNVLQRRGFSFSIPFRYRLRADTRLTSISFRPQLNIDQFRFFNLDGNANSDFTNRYGLEFFSQFTYRLLQLSRDIQPSSGLVLFGRLENTLNDASVTQILASNDDTELQVQRNFTKPTGLSTGAFLFLSPLRKYNQSLQLQFRALTQTEDLIFSTESLVPLGFDGDIFDRTDNNTLRFSSRYVIPIVYPDRGGLTVPAYLSSIYLSAFSHTIGSFSGGDFFQQPRTIIGAGLRFQFKLSNLIFDIGAGFAYEPSRSQGNFIVGEF